MNQLEQIWKNRQEHAGPCDSCAGCIAPYPFYGIGNEDADIVLVGMEPAYNLEDDNTKMSQSWGIAQTMMEMDRKNDQNPLWLVMKRVADAAGCDPGDLYFTNIAKCGGSENTREERYEHCSEYLDEELDYVDPNLILVFGKDATSHLKDLFDLGDVETMGDEHGAHYNAAGTDIVPLYHWGYIARSGDRQLWNEFVKRTVMKYT